MSIAEKLTQIAENEQKVYDAGKKAEYDAFWDSYQENGERDECRGMFSGKGWNENSINPKYDIYVAEGTYMFYRSGFVGSLKEHLTKIGKTIDFSNCKSFTGIFQYAQQLTEIPYVDMSGIPSSQTISLLCGSCFKLVNAEIKFSPLCSYSGCFNNCVDLENLTAYGEIGGNGLNFQWSTKLSKASITSIINALSSTTSGLTVTLSKTAVNNAFETSEDANDGSTSAEWNALINTKSNWTISLI